MNLRESGNEDVINTHIVAVGASAGGLEALTAFVSGLDSNLHCSYVIAHHTSPNYRSQMVAILSRETDLLVRDVVSGEIPKPNCIYVTPPGFHVVFKERHFELVKALPRDFPKPSIDKLFLSLAESFGERSVAVILSGTGSDGTIGASAVKTAGGLTIAQTPETAKYIGMVRSAIDAGFIEIVVAPSAIGEELSNLNVHPKAIAVVKENNEPTDELKELFQKVLDKTGIDFSNYKMPTVLRRIQRRIFATKSASLSDYLIYLKSNPEELDIFAKDTLISVTEFFRDATAFQLLGRYIKELVAQKLVGDEIRIWCAGCATGEEAYSLAILVAEELGEKFDRTRVQVFATDVDADALSTARHGWYNEGALHGVPTVIIDKYFEQVEEGFLVKKFIRDKILFTRHNLIADTPFIHIDLISCRNLLIYFNDELQKKAQSIFQYSLNNHGLLFLGRSENVDQQSNIFQVENRRLKIFRVEKEGRAQATDLPVTRARLPGAGKSALRAMPTVEQIFLTAAVDHYSIASVLIDQQTQILYSHGDVGKFISFPPGTPELMLGKIIVPEFRQEVLTAMYRAQQTKSLVRSRKRRISSLDQTWRFTLKPVITQNNAALFLVMFEEIAKKSAQQLDDDVTSVAIDDHTEHELLAAKEHLQAVIEELSASNMEMQALSEELQSTNEELQASNEELEATNQELQATNEELFSVNEESLKKSDALTVINADFEGVYNTLEFPVLVFDAKLRVKRVNVAATKMFHLDNVTGRHAAELPFPKYFSVLESNLHKAIISASKLEFSIHHEEKSFQIYVSPTFDTVGTVQGIVLLIVDNTNLISITKKQRETQDNLLSIMNNSVSLTSLKDITGRYEFVNNRFLEFTNLSTQEILGKTDFQLFDQKLAQQLRAGDLQVMSKLESVSAVEEMDFNGKTIWLSTVRFPIWDHDGAIKSICLQATDISHVKIAEEQLRLAAKVFDRSGEAIMITDAKNRIATVNEEFIKIYGYEFHELIGNDPRMLRADQHDKSFYAEMWRSLLDQGWWQGEICNRKKSGEHCQSWVTINAVYGLDSEIQNFVALFSDPNSIKIAQRKIEFMATHDELTRLPNRSLLMEKLKHGIAQAVRNKKKLAVLFIDLDNFKTINDTLGHDVGDILLKQASERLNSCVRGSDTLARLGGDEFVALLSDIDMDTVNHIATRTVDLLASPFRIRERDLFVSASVGISIFPDNGSDSTALLKNADTAMYRAKENGRNQYKFFTEEMKATAMQRLTIETAIRQALANDYFRIVYQPQLDMHTGEIVGAEALLRWDDPVLGDVPPSKFIPIVEAAGLIRQVGEMVLQKVLKHINTWRRKGLNHPVISINISATQLKHADFSRKLLDSINQYQVPTNALTLELTESVLTDNFESMNEILIGIKDSGIAISIDDFGTGYSSMMYLKRLPIHELKIDRSFIDGIDNDNDDLAIATAIIGMAHALGLKLVAEGVESKAQAKLLRNLGCHTAQGFLFHHPLEVEEFEKLFLEKPMFDAKALPFIDGVYHQD